MQVILGSNGTIGHELSKALNVLKLQVRLVSRNPHRYKDSDELFSADLLHFDQTFKALKNAEVAYLTAGLRYSHATWKEQWPRIMQNVIESCKRQGVKLVFFDNVYAYGPVNGWMSEESPLQPSSQKGAIRATIAGMLMDEV
ncbi:MAG TPA: NAD-dependent epimerase/dehydratase family protein, partial [Chitinophagaceae bacterium]|nr:NAD-dependent epimerase/dehydratase family protein [Chitinophagaceae bacterium]